MESAKLRAKTWAAGVANVWQSDKTCEIQNDFTCKKLPTFILSDAKKLILTGVGSFDYAMGQLIASGMREKLDELVITNKIN